MGELMKSMSEELAGAVETAGAGVVRVDARRRFPSTGIAWSTDGVIVTAHHTVRTRQVDEVQVGVAGEESASAELVGRDPSTDLAVLRVPETLESPTWAELDDHKVGHVVLALGRPGRTVQATMGIISALGDSWRTRRGGMIDRYLQTDVVMYPGFSGGPLVDAAGHVLGMNTSRMRGVSLTVPTVTVRRVVDAILEHGKVRRGYLGVGVQRVRLPKAIDDQESGLIIVSVEPESPADRGGLTLGDTILTLDGQAVTELEELLDLLSHDRVGRETAVRLVRAGEVRELSITVGERK